MFKGDRKTTARHKQRNEIDIADSPEKKPKNRRKVTDEQDNNLFDQQIQLMQFKDQEREEKALKKQKAMLEKQQQADNKQSDGDEVFQDCIDVGGGEEEFKNVDKPSIQEELKRLSGEKGSFKKQLQEQRINKLMLELKSK